MNIKEVRKIAEKRFNRKIKKVKKVEKNHFKIIAADGFCGNIKFTGDSNITW